MGYWNRYFSSSWVIHFLLITIKYDQLTPRKRSWSKESCSPRASLLGSLSSATTEWCLYNFRAMIFKSVTWTFYMAMNINTREWQLSFHAKAFSLEQNQQFINSFARRNWVWGLSFLIKMLRYQVRGFPIFCFLDVTLEPMQGQHWRTQIWFIFKNFPRTKFHPSFHLHLL